MERPTSYTALAEDAPIGHDALIELIHGATIEVLSTMLSLETLAGTAYFDSQPKKSDGVVSFVGLAGSRCVGTGSLQCDSEVACRLAARFLMSEFDAVDDEVLDAVGELTNMIVGNLKTTLENHLGQMGLSIPTVVYGKNFSTRSPGHEEWTVVPFSWGENRLLVRVCLKAKEGWHALQLGEKQEFVLER